MERFVFTNSAGDFIEISYTHEDNILKGYDGLTAAEVLPETAQGYNQQGYSLQRTRLGARYVTLEFYLRACDIESFYYRRKRLAQVFNPLLGTGKLEYTNDNSTYYLDAAVTVAPYPTEKLGTLQLFSVELTAHDPFFYGEEQVISAEEEIVPLTNPGDVPVPFTVVFAADTSPQIYLDDGTKIEVASGVNQQVTVKTGYGKKAAFDANGDINFNLITPDSSFFSLPTGTFNLNCGGIVTLTWKPLYAGV